MPSDGSFHIRIHYDIQILVANPECTKPSADIVMRWSYQWTENIDILHQQRENIPCQLQKTRRMNSVLLMD